MVLTIKASVIMMKEDKDVRNALKHRYNFSRTLNEGEHSSSDENHKQRKMVIYEGVLAEHRQFNRTEIGITQTL